MVTCFNNISADSNCRSIVFSGAGQIFTAGYLACYNLETLQILKLLTIFKMSIYLVYGGVKHWCIDIYAHVDVYTC